MSDTITSAELCERYGVSPNRMGQNLTWSGVRSVGGYNFEREWPRDEALFAAEMLFVERANTRVTSQRLKRWREMRGGSS